MYLFIAIKVTQLHLLLIYVKIDIILVKVLSVSNYDEDGSG